MNLFKISMLQRISTIIGKGRGADLSPPCAYTRKKSMVENSDHFLYIPKCIYGTLETIFHGQKTFGLAGGSLSWSETPYFP